MISYVYIVYMFVCVYDNQWGTGALKQHEYKLQRNKRATIFKIFVRFQHACNSALPNLLCMRLQTLQFFHILDSGLRSRWLGSRTKFPEKIFSTHPSFCLIFFNFFISFSSHLQDIKKLKYFLFFTFYITEQYSSSTHIYFKTNPA